MPVPLQSAHFRDCRTGLPWNTSCYCPGRPSAHSNSVQKGDVSMKLISFSLTLGLSVSLLSAQSSDLASLHSSLTTACKSIRGHAGRIVAEASEAELNKDVAQAHLREVAHYQEEMEENLKSAQPLLTAAQRKATDAEHKALEKVCETVKDLVRKLEKEFTAAKPERRAIRELATKMRNEMTYGKEVHDQLKKKLGIQ
jgi:uncharacterized protein YpuA (DUF1002 family)